MTIEYSTDYTLAAGQTLTFTNEDGFSMKLPADGSSAPDLTINGSVTVVRTDGPAPIYGVQALGDLFHPSTLTLGEDAVFKVSNTIAHGTAYGFALYTYGPSVLNEGQVEVSGDFYTIGFQDTNASASHTFTNDGVIKVTSVNWEAVAVSLDVGVFVNSGSIEAEGTYNETKAFRGSGSFLNTGTMRAVVNSTDPTNLSYGVYWAEQTQGNSWTNQGTIEADVALLIRGTNAAPTPFEFRNAGNLIGDVISESGPEKLINTGTITGDINLGGGSDIYDGSNGALIGVLHAGAGDDLISGGASAETFYGDEGVNTINGAGGADSVSGGHSDDHLDGGSGLDTLFFVNPLGALNVDLAAGSSTGDGHDTVTNFENVLGSSYGDTLVGTAGGNSLDGGAGADSISAGAGNDLIIAGDGADTVSGGADADVIDGGNGESFLRGDDGNDAIYGGADFDNINGNMGDDIAHGGSGVDWVVGGKDQDQLYGDTGDDIVLGNMGDDTCDGGAGADLIRGGQGQDVLTGGDGADWLSGDRGDDTLTGGAGADTFHTFSVAGLDRVTDFSLADGDRVQLDPGTTYTLVQSGADTVIDMGADGKMILVSVQMTSLTPGWIFTL